MKHWTNSLLNNNTDYTNQKVSLKKKKKFVCIHLQMHKCMHCFQRISYFFSDHSSKKMGNALWVPVMRDQRRKKQISEQNKESPRRFTHMVAVFLWDIQIPGSKLRYGNTCALIVPWSGWGAGLGPLGISRAHKHWPRHSCLDQKKKKNKTKRKSNVANIRHPLQYIGRLMEKNIELIHPTNWKKKVKNQRINSTGYRSLMGT